MLLINTNCFLLRAKFSWVQVQTSPLFELSRWQDLSCRVHPRLKTDESPEDLTHLCRSQNTVSHEVVHWEAIVYLIIQMYERKGRVGGSGGASSPEIHWMPKSQEVQLLKVFTLWDTSLTEEVSVSVHFWGGKGQKRRWRKKSCVSDSNWTGPLKLRRFNSQLCFRKCKTINQSNIFNLQCN